MLGYLAGPIVQNDKGTAFSLFPILENQKVGLLRMIPLQAIFFENTSWLFMFTDVYQW